MVDDLNRIHASDFVSYGLCLFSNTALLILIQREEYIYALISALCVCYFYYDRENGVSLFKSFWRIFFVLVFAHIIVNPNLYRWYYKVKLGASGFASLFIWLKLRKQYTLKEVVTNLKEEHENRDDFK